MFKTLRKAPVLTPAGGLAPIGVPVLRKLSKGRVMVKDGYRAIEVDLKLLTELSLVEVEAATGREYHLGATLSGTNQVLAKFKNPVRAAAVYEGLFALHAGKPFDTKRWIKRAGWALLAYVVISLAGGILSAVQASNQAAPAPLATLEQPMVAPAQPVVEAPVQAQAPVEKPAPYAFNPRLAQPEIKAPVLSCATK